MCISSQNLALELQTQVSKYLLDVAPEWSTNRISTFDTKFSICPIKFIHSPKLLVGQQEYHQLSLSHEEAGGLQYLSVVSHDHPVPKSSSQPSLAFIRSSLFSSDLRGVLVYLGG